MPAFHDNPRRAVNPNFHPVKLTLALCRGRARTFVQMYVHTGKQWDMRDLRNHGTPAGFYLPDEAVYSGPATIADIASWLRSNLRRIGA